MNRTDFKTRHSKYRVPLLLFFIVLLLSFPLLYSNNLILSIGVYILLYSILSMSCMIIIGYGGLLTVGHAAFYGIGAYAAALLSLNFGLPFSVCFLLSGVISALFGLIVALPCLRVSMDFLSLITLAFMQLYITVAQNWVGLTRGPMGLANIPDASLFGFKFDTTQKFYYLAFAVAALAYFFLSRLMNSPKGRAIQSIRDDEIGSRAVGINVNYHKVYIFVVGAFIAGLAGCLYAYYVGYMGSTSVNMDTTFLVMEMNILGGLGSLVGAVFGAIFFTIMPELIRGLATYRVGVGGLIMLLVITLRPQGVFGSRAFASKGGILAGKLALFKKRNEKNSTSQHL